ncbi:hypothetical protein CC78DRAFT_519037 [Lojkania enalia]|uniref:CHY-type domain-containing protein n=1 Tax=Lojkania enalia TaxID=147567 RepID=A0A9P4N2Z5_9PLEO|nr:hypothetical protein CC78DRAFT_519037 [Didymosphaeria enalia]
MSGNASSGTGLDSPLDAHGLSTCELPAPQPHRQGQTAQQPALPPRMPRCRYFGQKSGCRSGAACPFRHEVLDTAQQSTTAVQHKPAGRSRPSGPLQQSVGAERSPIVSPRSTAGRQHAAVNTSRITGRPVPQSQLTDPRAYQLAQVRRRYTPEERGEDGRTTLTFRLHPSDPDFPFDMDVLHCSLRVPTDYPNGGRPTLRVTNPDMERGYQINVERGFDKIVATSPSATLLAHLNALDRNLEYLLSSQKADTIKIVSHTKHIEKGEPSGPPLVEDSYQPLISSTKASTTSQPIIGHSAERVSQARQVREIETRQLEARLGRLAQFSKSTDGLTYTIPIGAARRGELPVELQAMKLIKLVVPADYDLTPCQIELVGVSGNSKSIVEEAFITRVLQGPRVSLLNHINHLSQNMHIMAREISKFRSPNMARRSSLSTIPDSSKPQSVGSAREAVAITQVSDRPHVVVIPRPEEWQAGIDDDGKSSDSLSEDDYGIADTTGTEHPPSLSTESANPERGVMISFPHLELHGIELLEIGTLNITVKCERCKDVQDISNLKKNNVGADSCKKCANPFALSFRPELMHVNSVCAGYLDLDGCTVVDMLPRQSPKTSFIPTCAECSTEHTRSGVTSVRGETLFAFCRECHKKMTFRLPEIKFLRLSPGIVRASSVPGKKRLENLGIVAGHELANRGRCSHYKKSYRWFRFSCCNKVYPCDRCHDQASDHPIEHANRMICGFCSREQNYRPKDCGICHAWLTAKPGKGFWEGGQGTRDKVKMSRKGKPKYPNRQPPPSESAQ